jgi:hypothetical protein
LERENLPHWAGSPSAAIQFFLNTCTPPCINTTTLLQIVHTFLNMPRPITCTRAYLSRSRRVSCKWPHGVTSNSSRHIADLTPCCPHVTWRATGPEFCHMRLRIICQHANPLNVCDVGSCRSQERLKLPRFRHLGTHVYLSLSSLSTNLPRLVPISSRLHLVSVDSVGSLLLSAGTLFFGKNSQPVTPVRVEAIGDWKQQPSTNLYRRLTTRCPRNTMRFIYQPIMRVCIRNGSMSKSL